MSPQRALRLAMRPLSGFASPYRLAAAAASNAKSKLPPSRPPICPRCSITINSGAGTSSTRARFFSTAPPPPRQPPPPPSSPEDKSSKPEPQTSIPDNIASTTTPPVPPPPAPQERPAHTEPEPSSSSPPDTAPSETPSSPPPEPNPTPTDPPTDPPSDPAAEPDRTLPSFTETHRHPLSARFSTFMDNLQSRALTATQTLNDLTGYSAIESIKSHNAQLEQDLATAQARLRAARHNYKSLTTHRANTQREVTTLLARKDSWAPPDLERFTTLYRADHELEAQVAGAGEELTEAEADEARLSGQLNAGILRRYHEEQIWSDRIRRQSTWGTWGLMGVNVVLFLVLQFVAEPWRRRRLMRGIAEREEGVFEEVRRELGEVRAALAASAAAAASGVGRGMAADAAVQVDVDGEIAAATETVGSSPASAAAPVEVPDWQATSKPWKEVLMEYWEDPELLREDVQDLYSDRKIALRMRDASLIALQGAAAGAAVVATLAFALLRSSRT